MRKVDRNVGPWLAALCAWSLIDLKNIGNAQIEQIGIELRLGIENRYSITLLVFFPFYFISELPATLLVRHISPRYVITFIAVTWGLVIVCMGFVKVWGALAALRCLLGLLEGGHFFICVFLLSSWYKRYELQKRITFFYMFGVFASGVDSILAYGLARIGPRGNYRPWSFIFFLEGVFTIALGCVVFFFIVEFPKTQKRRFLSPRDHTRVLYRLERDCDDLELDPLTVEKLGKYLLEWRAWIMGLMFMCYRIKLRAPFIVFHSALCFIGLGVLYAPNIPATGSYAAVFLVAAGTNANMPFVIGYLQNNIHTSSRRTVMSALQVRFGAIGGIFSSLVFRQQDAPVYRPGLLACLACNGFTMLWVGIFTVYFHRENKKQKAGLVIADKPGFRFAI